MRFILALVFIGLSGCAVYNGGAEAVKTVWGSSTRALESARDNALTKTYDKNYWDVLKGALEVSRKQGYVIFKQDEIKGYLVLMGIKGSVNTTEAGVFFIELNDSRTRVEISSLSANAKRLAAKTLFHGLDIIFGLAPPDPEEPKKEKPDESKP